MFFKFGLFLGFAIWLVFVTPIGDTIGIVCDAGANVLYALAASGNGFIPRAWSVIGIAAALKTMCCGAIGLLLIHLFGG